MTRRKRTWMIIALALSGVVLGRAVVKFIEFMSVVVEPETATNY
jgi:hypothetical protein